jgi:hypothetical protein
MRRARGVGDSRSFRNLLRYRVMRVKVASVRSSRLGSRLAVFAVGVVWLGGCGRASGPGAGNPVNAGGSAGSDGQGAGEGGGDHGATGGAAGRGEPSDAGRGAGGGASGGTGGTVSGGAGGEASGGTGSGTASAGAGGSGVQGGVGGTAPLPNLPLPASCQALGGSATELLCALDVSCDAVAQTMRCYHTSSGAWQCTCAPPNANRMYVIEGAAGLDACAVGAGLCAGAAPEPGFVLGSCGVTRDELGTDFEAGVGELATCTVEVQCETPVAVDFAPGVRATMPGVGVTHCVEAFSQDRTSEERRVDCETNGSLGAQSHALVAQSLGAACRSVVEFYLTSQEPEFDGSQSCVGAADDLGLDDACRLIETCFDSAPVSSGVSVVKSPSKREAFCSFDSFDQLYCGCRFESATGAVETFSYGLGVAERPASCDLSSCTLETTAEPTGPGACQVQQNSGEHDDDSCTDAFLCNQPAMLAGQDVTISSWLYVHCARGDDDAFYCGCAAGEETATYRADNLTSSVDACAAARTDCLTHLSLPVGPASDSTRAPDPLLGL